MIKITRSALRLTVAMLGLLTIPAWAGGFDIDWFTIDGGGGTSTGGAFTLSGTIGQPDAGVTMTGGSFSLTGGFWVVTGVDPCSGDTRGDANCDGAVNFNDIDCFVSALVGSGSWTGCGAVSACNYQCVNDVNRDGSVDFNDIGDFVTCLVGSGCP